MRVAVPVFAGALICTSLIVGSSGVTSAAAKKPVLKIMDVSTFASTTQSEPDTLWTVDAYFDAVNAGGGINGYKFDVIACNDQFSQNVAAACARKAVADHVIAVVAPSEENGAQVIPILQKAGIPYLSGEATAITDLQNSDSFPFDGGAYTVFAGLGEAMVKASCKNIGVVVLGGLPITELAASVMQGVAKSANIPFEESQVGFTDVNFSAPVETLTSAGATCIAMTVTPSEGPLVVQAIAQSGAKVQVFASQSQFTVQSLQTLGTSANGITEIVDEYIPSSIGNAGVQLMNKDMAKYEKGNTVADVLGVGGFGVSYALGKVVGSIKGAVTAKSVKLAFEHTTHVNTDGIYGPFSFEKSTGVKGAPRLFNPSFLTFAVRTLSRCYRSASKMSLET